MHVVVGAATDFGPELFGGIASYVLDLSSELRSHMDVTLLGISRTRGEGGTGPAAGHLLFSADPRIPSNRASLVAAIMIRRHRIRDLSPNVQYAHSPEVGLAMSLANPDIPLVLHVHGTESTLRSSRFRVARSLPVDAAFGVLVERPAFRRAARIIVTADQRRYSTFLNALPGCIQAKCVRVPSMVNLRRYARLTYRRDSVGPVKLVAVGRLVPRKGFDVVLRALGILRASGVSATLRIVGAGPEDRALERLADDLGIRGDVTFSGYVTRERMVAHLADTDLYVSGSVQEGFSMSALESLACGVPVIGFDVGGAPEIVLDGETGAVAGERSPSGLAHAVQRLLPVTQAMRVKCTEVAEKYSSVTVAAQIRSVLEQAAGLERPEPRVTRAS